MVDDEARFNALIKRLAEKTGEPVEIPAEEPDDIPTPHRYTKPLDQWRQLPEWKRLWFERLSQRELYMIFPNDSENIEEWMRDQRWTRSGRKFFNKIGQIGVTLIIGIVVSSVASLLYLGFQATMGKH